MQSDAELVAAALVGGPEAFGLVVRRYQDAVFGVALARLGNFHDAQDVAQEAFVEAFQRIGSLRDPARLGAWLRSVTIHRALNHLRRRREMTDEDEATRIAADDPTPHGELERKELRERVLAAIARLSKTQRETTTLFYINGYSVEEVAAIQEVPSGTVKRRLYDAREKMKKEMIGVVEEVLKSEAPKEDFAKNVFDILCQHRASGDHPYAHLGWGQLVEELRRMGPKGMEGFVQAFQSPHSPTRALAAHMLNATGITGETVIELLKRALSDPNRKVRRSALEALLQDEMDVSDERKRKEFVPLVVPLLRDRSKRVRRLASWHLQHGWSGEVPLETAARAVLEEKDRVTRRLLEGLLRTVLNLCEKRKDSK